MKFFKIISISLFCILLSCSKAKEDIEPVAFHAEVTDIEAYSAKATITHNATNRDPYYGIVVEGEVSDVSYAIDYFLESATDEELKAHLHYQRKSVFALNQLAPEKTYTFIAFGMNDKKKLYGTPAVAIFETTKSDFKASVNPNWKIEYKGPTVYNNNDYSLITVSVIGDVEERFFLATYTVEKAKTFNTMEELIMTSIYDFIHQKENDINVDYWLEDSGVRTKGTNFYRYLTEGNYISYAIGINTDGSPTGHYVKTPAYHVDKYPADEMYVYLLGEWIITDNKGKTLNVTFAEKTVNKSLLMYGFGGLQKQAVVIAYNRSDSTLTIDAQTVTDNISIKFSDGTTETGKLSLTGAYYNKESKLKQTTSVTTLTKGTPGQDGAFTFETNFYITLEDGTKLYDTGMMYVLKKTDGTSTMFGVRMFPLTMHKKTE